VTETINISSGERYGNVFLAGMISQGSATGLLGHIDAVPLFQHQAYGGVVDVIVKNIHDATSEKLGMEALLAISLWYQAWWQAYLWRHNRGKGLPIDHSVQGAAYCGL
jgi:hypothetical protein